MLLDGGAAVLEWALVKIVSAAFDINDSEVSFRASGRIAKETCSVSGTETEFGVSGVRSTILWGEVCHLWSSNMTLGLTEGTTSPSKSSFSGLAESRLIGVDDRWRLVCSPRPCERLLAYLQGTLRSVHRVHLGRFWSHFAFAAAHRKQDFCVGDVVIVLSRHFLECRTYDEPINLVRHSGWRIWDLVEFGILVASNVCGYRLTA